MSTSTPTALLLEWNGFSVRATLLAGRQLQFFQERSADDPALVQQLVATVRTRLEGASVPVTVALTSPNQSLHLVSRPASSDWPPPKGWWSLAVPSEAPSAGWVLDAATGQGPGSASTRCVIAVAGAAEAAGGTLFPTDLGTPQLRCAGTALTFSAISQALAPTPERAVVAWDLASQPSTLALIDARGIQKIVTTEVDWNQAVDEVQKALNLRFRSAAVKLMFNDLFDFADIGPRVAQTLAAGLQKSLSELGAPSADWFVAGLPARPAWLAKHLGVALGRTLWQPDLAAYARAARIEIGSEASTALASPGAVASLYWAAALADGREPLGQVPWATIDSRDKPAKSAVLTSPLARVSPTTPASTAPSVVAVEAVVVELDPPPAAPVKHIAPPASPAEAPRPAVTIATAAAAPARPDEPKKAEPVAAHPPPSAPAPSAAPRKATDSPQPATPAVAPTKPVEPPSAPSLARYPGAGEPKTRSQRSHSRLAWIALAVVALAATGGVAYKFHHEAKEAQALAEAERLAAEARVEALARQAREENERIAREAEAARVQALEVVRRELEADAQRKLEAERLAHAPGSLALSTEPVGASVAIDGARPLTAPVRLDDVRAGRREIVVSAPGYAPRTVHADIQGTKLTDLGVVTLERLVGRVAITSEPAGLAFELKGVPSGLVLHTGTTPATLDRLPTGSYQAVIHRPGWTSATQNVEVVSGDVRQVNGAFTTGRLSITSTPAGAHVHRNGIKLGETPLELHDLEPAPIELTLHLPGYQDIRLTGTIVASETQRLEATLQPVEPVLRLSDLATPPLPIKRVAPDFDRSLGIKSGRVFLSFVVGESGSPTDIRVEDTTDPRLVEACVAALEQWRFNPGKTADGKAAKTRLHQLFQVGRDFY